MKEIEFVKVGTRLLKTDAERLKAVAKRTGFSSDYALLRYLIHTFLRVADPKNDVIDTPLAPELAELFRHDKGQKKRLEAVYKNFSRAAYALRDFNMKAGKYEKHNEPVDEIADEIADMFEDCENDGAAKTYPADIMKRTVK